MKFYGFKVEITKIRDTDMPHIDFIAWQTSRFAPTFNGVIIIRGGLA